MFQVVNMLSRCNLFNKFFTLLSLYLEVKINLNLNIKYQLNIHRTIFYYNRMSLDIRQQLTIGYQHQNNDTTMDQFFWQYIVTKPAEEKCNKKISTNHCRQSSKIESSKHKEDISIQPEGNNRSFNKSWLKCQQCPKKYSSKIRLDHHITKHHVKLYSFVCSICKHRFKTQHKLLSHAHKHHVDNDFIERKNNFVSFNNLNKEKSIFHNVEMLAISDKK